MNGGIRSHTGGPNLKEGCTQNGVHNTFSCFVQQLWAKGRLSLSTRFSSFLINPHPPLVCIPSGKTQKLQLRTGIVLELRSRGTALVILPANNCIFSDFSWKSPGWGKNTAYRGQYEHGSMETAQNSEVTLFSWLSGSVIYTAAWFWGREHEYVQYTVAHTVCSVSLTVAHCTHAWGWSSTGDRRQLTHWLLC